MGQHGLCLVNEKTKIPLLTRQRIATELIPAVVVAGVIPIHPLARERKIVYGRGDIFYQKP